MISTIASRAAHDTGKRAFALLCSLILVTNAVQASQDGWFPEDGTLWKLVDGGLVDAGALIFEDTFDDTIGADWQTGGTQVWEVKDGMLLTKGYGGQALLGMKLDENYLIDLRMKIVASDPERSGGFAGVSVAGILSTMQPDRWWQQYRREGADRNEGHRIDTRLEIDKWYEFRFVKRGDIFEWFVDGQKIADLINPGDIIGPAGRMQLQSWRMKAAYDSVRIYSINDDVANAAEGYVNVVRNSSFERYEVDLPPYWFPGTHLNIGHTFGSMENFWRSFKVDTSESFDGSAVLRLKGGDKGNFVVSHWTSVQANKPYTLSVYLKSDQDSMPVSLGLWGVADGRRVVEVDTEWNRYSLHVPKLDVRRLRVSITPQGEGYLWVDAVQLEEGTEATPYRPNPLDQTRSTAAESDEVPEYTLLRVDKAPMLGERMDEPMWNERVELDASMIPASIPQIADDVAVKVAVLDASGNKLLREVRRRVTVDSSMRAIADRSYYTDEEHAYLHARLGFADDVLKKTVIRWQLKNDDDVIKEADVRTDHRDQILKVSLHDIPVGQYEFVMTLLDDNGEVVASADDVVVKLEPAPTEVKIDRVRRVVLVDGEPFYVFAPLQVFHVPNGHPYGEYDKVIDRQMAWWAEHGFKTLHVGANVGWEWSDRIWRAVFESADRHGLKVIAFWTSYAYDAGDGPLIANHEELERQILKWKDEASLLAWMPADEPEIKGSYGVTPEMVAEAVQKVRELDPYRPVYVNYTQFGPVSCYAGLPGDILSLDYYLTSVEGRTIEQTLHYVDVMEEISSQMRTPTWNYIVGNNLNNHHREASAGEQVAQTYANVIKGVSGLKYFYGQVIGRQHWYAYKQLNEEIQQLTPIIFSGDTIDNYGVYPSTILSTARRHQGKTYVMAVNIRAEAIGAAIDLSDLGEIRSVNVLFEDRTLQVEGGLLKDNFEPYQRHVYEIVHQVQREADL
ncbi:hypothetical protein ACERK3_18580 [Phycisphaerales bacterium AB-hyl4]|uniref:CBM-cenC domain-containing protein n=1 Tax=Natronomicrosphaera hydrolytica TaxID=3242702 RepID=A0ABV4UBE8_9BACT